MSIFIYYPGKLDTKSDITTDNDNHIRLFSHILDCDIKYAPHSQVFLELYRKYHSIQNTSRRGNNDKWHNSNDKVCHKRNNLYSMESFLFFNFVLIFSNYLEDMNFLYLKGQKLVVISKF